MEGLNRYWGLDLKDKEEPNGKKPKCRCRAQKILNYWYIVEDNLVSKTGKNPADLPNT